MHKLLLISLIWLSAGHVRGQQNATFPADFLFGAATASYQIEGAWNISDKTENIWDYMTHNFPWKIRDGSNGDVAADSYHQYARDADMAGELGLDFYRFSLSWARLLPDGLAARVSPDGAAYYSALIDELLARGVQPMVTIFHWDMPQRLQELGGWANELSSEWFADFARVCFELFGDRVRWWITINEPHEICYLGYALEMHAPALDDPALAFYHCARNVVLAHARAWHIYNDHFRASQQGRVSLSVATPYYEAATDSSNDIQAAEDLMQFTVGIYTHPIFSTEGDFPPQVREYVARNSEAQGFPWPRLPAFSADQVAYIRGTYDFYGLNHYTMHLAYRNSTVNLLLSDWEPSFIHDVGALYYEEPYWPQTYSPWARVMPQGLRGALRFVRDHYGNPDVLITESGCSSPQGLEDDARVEYLRLYMQETLLARLEDGCNVVAYTAWSLLDNFEWSYGYSLRYGLYEVDYEHPNKTRTARKSAYMYKEVIRSRVVDFNYEPDMTVPIDG